MGTDAALAGLARREQPAPRRVAIIGAGIGGLSLAWALGRAGHRVTVFDAAALPNRHGSSADDGRIIRHVYGTVEGYAAMMPAAHRAWAALFAETGANRLSPCRALYVLREEGPWQAAAQRALDAAGLSLTVLDEKALAALPIVNREGVLRVVEVEGSGILQALAVLADLLAMLPRTGVTIAAETPVAALDPDAGVLHLASGERVEADAVVVAAGIGAAALLPDAASEAGLRASVQTLAYLDPPARLASAWNTAPMLLCRLPGHETGGVYVLPPRGGARLKLGDYASSADADPATDHAALRADRVAALLDAGGRAIADFGTYRLAALRHCHYTMAPEDRFAVRRAGRKSWLLSACSGHGFKLAPLISLGLAAAIEERMDDAALAAWAAGDVPERADA